MFNNIQLRDRNNNVYEFEVNYIATSRGRLYSFVTSGEQIHHTKIRAALRNELGKDAALADVHNKQGFYLDSFYVEPVNKILSKQIDHRTTNNWITQNCVDRLANNA